MCVDTTKGIEAAQVDESSASVVLLARHGKKVRGTRLEGFNYVIWISLNFGTF